MITQKYFESGKPFEFRGSIYSCAEDLSCVMKQTRINYGLWKFHCNVKSITSVGVIVTPELFGQETASLIKFEDLTPIE